jgi:hypothetical protein
VEKKIWCAACPCYVRDDNLLDHVVTDKHKKKALIVVAEGLHQTKLGDAIKNSTTLSKTLSSRTHQFRVELVETILKAGKPIAEADEYRPFHEKWCQVESTGSNHLLGDYLSIVKVYALD